MRIFYDYIGERIVPFYERAKSSHVRIWDPKRGWVQQTNYKPKPYDPASGITLDFSMNAMIPLLKVHPDLYEQTLQRFMRTLPRNGGHLFVCVRWVTEKEVYFGVMHDDRFLSRSDWQGHGQSEFLSREVRALPLEIRRLPKTV